MKPKILVLDIETKPAIAYVWRMFDENISLDQLIEPGDIICVGYQFLEDKTTSFVSEWGDGYEGMLKAIHAAISEADAVVTFNGNRFDLPKLQGAFLKIGLPPVPPITSIDLYKTVKKLGYQSNKLGFVGPFLELGRKIKHEGFELWAKVMDGNVPAQRRMERYCRGDVRLTARLYLKLRPYITNHPHMALTKGHECGACGSKHLQSRGFRRTKSFKIQRLQCQGCGSWQDGVRSKV
jgi:hypothetical protein